MMFDIKEFHRADSVSDAIRLLGKYPEARLISGGTDVLVKIRHLKNTIPLVDIHDLQELRFIELEGDSLILGAGSTFTDAANSNLIRKYLPVLREACLTVAGPQIRNMGTIGGNIANGATSADTAAPMLILEPVLMIEGPNGRREADLINFHIGPGRVALDQNEILVGFRFDLSKLKGLNACYYKYAMRSAMDIATIGCAAGVKIDDGIINDLRLALTVAAPTPIRCRQAEAAGMGKPLNDRTISAVVNALDGDIKPRTSWRATREFRTRIIKALAERMIRSAADRADEVS